MKETQLFGKLLPSHPDILPILEEIREKYQIPEISPYDDSLRVFLEYDLEIGWGDVHGEILERLKETDLLPEKTKKFYNATKNMQVNPFYDPEFENVSEEFRNGIKIIIESFVKNYEPVINAIDGMYREFTNLCLEFLLTGEARELPPAWFCTVDVMDIFGEKVILAMANQVADPEDVAEMFKAKYRATFGKHRPKITEKHVKTADFLRMRWEGKSIAYLLEEENISAPATRKRHDKMRQELHRLKKTIYRLVT